MSYYKILENDNNFAKAMKEESLFEMDKYSKKNSEIESVYLQDIQLTEAAYCNFLNGNFDESLDNSVLAIYTGTITPQVLKVLVLNLAEAKKMQEAHSLLRYIARRNLISANEYDSFEKILSNQH